MDTSSDVQTTSGDSSAGQVSTKSTRKASRKRRRKEKAALRNAYNEQPYYPRPLPNPFAEKIDTYHGNDDGVSNHSEKMDAAHNENEDSDSEKVDLCNPCISSVSTLESCQIKRSKRELRREKLSRTPKHHLPQLFNNDPPSNGSSCTAIPDSSIPRSDDTASVETDQYDPLSPNQGHLSTGSMQNASVPSENTSDSLVDEYSFNFCTPSSGDAMSKSSNVVATPSSLCARSLPRSDDLQLTADSPDTTSTPSVSQRNENTPDRTSEKDSPTSNIIGALSRVRSPSDNNNNQMLITAKTVTITKAAASVTDGYTFNLPQPTEVSQYTADLNQNTYHLPQHTPEFILPIVETPPPPRFSLISQVEVQRCIEDLRATSQCEMDLPEFIPIIRGQDIEYVKHMYDFVRLGEGGFADIYLGRMKVNGQLVAVKINQKFVSLSEFINECAIHHKLTNTRITTQLHGIVPLEESSKYMGFAIVSEFVGDESKFESHTLANLINEEIHYRKANNESEKISNLDWMRLCIRIIRCVQYVHKKDIVINDIKANNILVKRKAGLLVPVMIDFGLAGTGTCYHPFTVQPELANTFLMKHRNLAPELVYNRETTTASDIYAVGRILQDISKAAPSLELDGTITDCLSFIPEIRPTAEELLTVLKKKLDSLLAL